MYLIRRFGVGAAGSGQDAEEDEHDTQNGARPVKKESHS
jgi:hypothetical protein